MKPANIFDIKNTEGRVSEVFETLVEGSAKIERIISHGQITPENEWFDQDNDEWVILLQGQATILIEDIGEMYLLAGSYLLIPAHHKHRVTYTSESPACIWLAVHGNF
ncbi:MAG: cupin domain-containing protein [Lentimicrobium sp.]